jgi:Protein of unknown function (DUF2795)
MERESTQHGHRLDDEMAKEVASLTHGAPIESRSEEGRLLEDAGEGEPAAEPLVDGEPSGPAATSGLSYRAARDRSELARHLRPSIFPATREAIIECARDEYAEDDWIARLQQLPEAEYGNVNEVWEAIGGHAEESRDHSVAQATHPTASGSPGESAPGPRTETRRQPRSEPRAELGLTRFPFRFDWRYRVAGLALGITPGRASVTVDTRGGSGVLYVRFGLWTLHTPLSNVVGTSVTGPFTLPKTIGPPHLSMSDRGLTFATSADVGLCISFAEPVAAIEPIGVLRHPALTVTVADVHGLAEMLDGRH